MLFDNYLIDYYEQSFLNALVISSYAVSMLIPFGLWFLIGLLIHMMSIIVNKPGSIRELYHISGICFIPFLANFIFIYILLLSTNINIGSELSILVLDPNYNVKIADGISLSLIQKIGTFCSLICIVLYCLVVYKVYKASLVQSIICVMAPIGIFLLMKELFIIGA